MQGQALPTNIIFLPNRTRPYLARRSRNGLTVIDEFFVTLAEAQTALAEALSRHGQVKLKFAFRKRLGSSTSGWRGCWFCNLLF